MKQDMLCLLTITNIKKKTVKTFEMLFITPANVQ